jgi:hypothetical protein
MVDRTIREQHSGMCPGLLCYRNEGKRYDETLVRGSDGVFTMENYFGQIAILDNDPIDYIRVFHGIKQIWDRNSLFKAVKPGDVALSDRTSRIELDAKIERFLGEIGADVRD